MSEKSKSNKPEWLTAIGAILLSALTASIAHHTTKTGEVAVPKELLIDTAAGLLALVGWLVSWLVVFRKRDAKRERIRFAREAGRRICACTETGEIMVVRQKQSPEGTFDWLVCPACAAWTFPEDPMLRDRPRNEA